MAFGRIKVLVGQVDNTELDESTERLLTKDDLAFGEDGDSQKVTESGGQVTAIEFFRGLTQTEANRKARVDISYTDGLPTSEIWKYYEDNGTSIKRTITLTHTWVSGALDKTEESVS